MGGGGSSGGSSSIEQRNPSQEKGTVGNWYDFQNNQAQNYVAGNPLLSAGQAGALGYNSQLGGLLGQFPGFQSQLGNYQNQIGGYQSQLGGYASQIPTLQQQSQQEYGNLQSKLGTQSNQLGGWLNGANGPAGIIASGGALTPQMSRDVSQQTRAIASAQGTAASPGALGNELLNRDQYRQQRYNTALGQGQGLLGQQANDYGLQGNLLGQNMGIQQGLLGLGGNFAGQGAGLSSLGAGLTGQNAGLLGQEQGLQTGGLNQLLGSANANTQNFTGLTNPILGYLGNLFGGNQQASIANAQIQAQQQAAAGNKSSGLASGGASAIASIAPIALAAFSDKRLKQDIKSTGLKTKDGIPIKTFAYKTLPNQRMIGVMAQDVEKKLPHAVITDALSGLKLIDRTKIDVPMGRIG